MRRDRRVRPLQAETGQPMLGKDLTVADDQDPLRIGAVSEAGGSSM